MEYLIRRKLDMENNEQVMSVVYLGLIKVQKPRQIIRQMSRAESKAQICFCFSTYVLR